MSSKEELYKALVESAPFGTLFFVYGVCIDANPKALQQLGCDKQQLIGLSLTDDLSGGTANLASLKEQLAQSVRDEVKLFKWQAQPTAQDQPLPLFCRLTYPGDNEKELIVTIQDEPPLLSSLTDPQPEIYEDPQPQEIEIRFDPIPEGLNSNTVSHDTQNVKVERRALSSQLDTLTNLPNRPMLLKHINRFLQRNSGGKISGALLMLDLDHFKDINDSWGHAVGDQVIRKVGRLLANFVRGENMLARLSGDEFLLFVPNLNNSEAGVPWTAQSVAEKIRDIIATPLFLDGHEVMLSASIGIALLDDASLPAEVFFQQAETAMYEAKRRGRNRITFFDPCLTEQAQRQINMNARLRNAIANQEFALFLQPQISVHSGELVGGEALLRWINSDRVTNMPSEFIPVLEASGLIVDVGRWVIRTACEYLRNLTDAGLWLPGMKLGINISPRQFHDPKLVETIEHSIGSYGISPDNLNFEITESLVIEDVDDAITKMKSIKDLGASFSIDDFGIGYSSLLYLKKLPLDQLKIDREFIRNIHTDQESRGVVEAIMAVSRQYGLHVTAEGVENRESLDVVRRVGCDTYQGAHYSMPVPFKQFRDLLAA